jgi:hypothetical protein
MKKKSSISFIIFFYSISSFAQNIIQGSVYDSSNMVVQDVNVVLVNSISNEVIDYAFTDKNGKYKTEAKDIGQFQITFSHIGHESKTIEIRLKESQKNYNINATLENKLFILNEVIVQSGKPISIKNDTVSFKTSFFTDGTEQTVEELLKKIPGIQVDSEGTIKVGNQEIEKLMVDGDDLFERGYKILSKNMPAYPIEEVELLKNYSNNRLLKGLEESEKVALNLKLDEKSKHIWFGNIDMALGNDSFYQLKGNLMNFSKKNKYYFLSNLNSTGYDATGDIQNLIRPFRYNEPASVGDNHQVNDLLSLSPSNFDFKRERTNFNNAELLSLNAIFNPTEKTKIKSLGFFNWNETDFFQNSIDFVNVNGTSFTNTEDYQISNKKRIAFGKIDFIHDFSKTQMLEAVSKFNSGNFNDGSNLVFNGVSTIENLRHKNTLFDQKITFTNKFKDKKVLLLTGRFIDEKTPQNYHINQFFFEDLFPQTEDVNNLRQSAQNQMQFAGFNAHLMDKTENGNLLELQVGNEYRKDILISGLSLLENETVTSQPIGYQNHNEYQVNDLYLKGKYRYKMGDFSLVGRLDFHQLFNNLKSDSNTSRQNPFFINQSLGFDWKINDKNKIISTFTQSTTNAEILDIYSDFVLTGYRSFSKGTGNFDQLRSSSVTLNYQLGNWTDRFFTNTFISYVKNHDFFSTNTLLEQNYTQSERILIKDREFLSINTKLDYFFKIISSNLKVDLGYTKGEFKNIVNNSYLRLVTSNNYNYGFELRSGFKGIFNYHIGTKWTISEVKANIINSFTNYTSFLDLIFVINERLDLQAQTERYYFGNLETDNLYYFLDFDICYKFIKNKMTLGLTGNNLFDTKVYRNVSISDIGTSTTEYRLLPRFGLLKMEYRF